MKKVLALVIAVILLMSMTPFAYAANETVYVSVSVGGKLEIAAQPVTTSDMTVQGAIKAAHAAYYSGGDSGYTAGIDQTWNMFMITQVWGVESTPYIIVNGAPLGADQAMPASADTYPVKAGDNIIISVSADPMVLAQAVSLTASVKDGSATVTATNWTLDFTTFVYSGTPLIGAAVVDPVTGASLGTTDSNGSITITAPESGIIAIDGLAAIPVNGSSASTTAPAAEGNALSGEGITVYVSVSISGKLEIAAKPVTVSGDMTVQDAIKAAHTAYYSGGERGYSASIDKTWNMFMITRVWGVFGNPYIIVNGAPLGSDFTKPASADTAKVKAGDNIIISVSGDMQVPAQAISLTASVDGESATVKAKSWELDFTTFQYSTSALVGAEVVDPETGTSLGTTDINGSIIVPAGGVVAVGGFAAIPVDGSSASTKEAADPSKAGNSFGFGGKDAPREVTPEENKSIVFMVLGIIVILPVIGAICINVTKRIMKSKQT